MGLLGRIFGGRKDPPGTTYFVEGSPLVGGGFRVERVLPGQTIGSPDLKSLGPHFTDEIEAGRYLSSLDGGLPYRYPPGAV